MDTISIGVDGVPTGHMNLGRSSMSDNGRYVLFSSAGGVRLVKGDACVYGSCIFLRDRRTGKTTVMSSRSDGTPVPDKRTTQLYFDISGDGRLVAFTTASRRLVPLGDRHPRSMLYLKHVRTGRLEAIPTPKGGNRGEPLQISAYQITRHGRYVVTSGTFPGGSRVVTHVYDRVEDTWEQIGDPTLSLRYEAMSPRGARQVVVSDIATGTDVRVADRITGAFKALPRGPAPANAHMQQVNFSGNGRFLFVDWSGYDQTGAFVYARVCYRSRDLAVLGEVDTGTDASIDAVSYTGRYLAVGLSGEVFGSPYFQLGVHDRKTQQTTLISRSPEGDPGNSLSVATDISLDGTTVLFGTAAGNIAPEFGDQRVPDPDFADDYTDHFVATLTPEP